jgi:hypothetical protein
MHVVYNVFMYVLNYLGVNANKDTAVVQLQQLELGRSAFQAKVDSVRQYNQTISSTDKALGLPTDCQLTAPAKARSRVATSSNSNSSSTAPIICHDCCSSSSGSSSNGSVESCNNRKGAATRHRSREKELKDYAYSKALIDFEVLYYILLSCFLL